MDKTKFAATLLISTLLFSGCAERGYKLTLEPNTHTATAQIATDIRKQSSKTVQQTFQKMEKAVKKALKKSYPTKQKRKALKNKAVQSEQIIKEKRLEEKREQEELKKAKMLEKKRQLALIEKEKKAQLLLQKEKNEALKNKQAKTEREKALREQRRIEKEMEEKKQQQQQEKVRLMEEKRRLQQIKEQEEMRKKLQKKTKLQTIEKKQINTQKEQDKKLKETLLHTKKPLKTKEAKSKTYIRSSEPITFVYLNKTYQKFGTSEIHGRVVYLTQNGQEVTLNNVKVYLLPVGANLDFWYKNYYLNNKEFGFKKLKAYYLNKTGIDLGKNFAFYGVPAGNYYIIIEASTPASKNKKIYIAKKVHVEKYKKVIAVFSKKL